MTEKLEKGDIWIANLEPAKRGELGKTRPVIIFQNNDANVLLETVTVIPLSSKIKQYNSISIRIIATNLNNLGKDSAALCSHITTIHKRNLIKRIGWLGTLPLKELEEAIILHLNIDTTNLD